MPVATATMVLLEGEGGVLVMVPRDPPIRVYVPPHPCPPWLDDADARAVVMDASGVGTTPAPVPTMVPLGLGMSTAAARATADWLTAAGAEGSPIHVVATAVRSGASAARYAACVGATTIGEYIRPSSSTS